MPAQKDGSKDNKLTSPDLFCTQHIGESFHELEWSVIGTEKTAR